MCVKVIFNFGPFEWPARSPDLSPMDFFLWGVLEDMVYKEKPRTIPEIRRVIADKIATIDVELCQKVCRSVAARLVSYIKTTGNNLNFSISIYHCCGLTSFLLIIVSSLFYS